MTCEKDIVRVVAVGMLAMGMAGVASAQAIAPDQPLVRHLVVGATYVRETRDQAWHIRVTAPVPTPPGLYVAVYKENGDILKHGEVPAGTYSLEAPFVLDIPADGLAQEYVIKLVGVNRNFEAVTLPMTDLPFEVYQGEKGGTTFVMPYPVRGELRRLAFQVKAGGEKVVLTAGDQALRLLDSQGTVVAEAGSVDGTGKGRKELAQTLQPGRTYWLDPVNANQFQTAPGAPKIYFTFDPARWFHPTIQWTLDSRPWWKGLFK